jgi:AraC-like DNA-binding protein
MRTDTLDKLLITLAVRLHAFAICEIKYGWRLAFDPMEAVTIHYVLAGSGTLRVGDAPPVAFTQNNMMAVPPRFAQRLETGPVQHESDASEHCRIVSDGLVTFTAGDGSRDLLVICGTISASYAGAFGLFDHLNGPMVQDLAAQPAIKAAFELLLREVASPGLGTQALTEALMKQCLILLLRDHLAATASSPLLAALGDQRLARAVTAVIEAPAAPHSVERLASLAGMSRSSFAKSFSDAFGEAPMEFVQRVRLRLAAHLLAATDLPVKVIASSIGYASRSHFSRAFRAAYGLDPSTFRATGGHVEEEPAAAENEGLAAPAGVLAGGSSS